MKVTTLPAPPPVTEPVVLVELTQLELDYITFVLGQRGSPRGLGQVFEELNKAGGRAASDRRCPFMNSDATSVRFKAEVAA